MAKQIAIRLVPGGIVGNYDLFPDPAVDYREDEVHDRTCATLGEAEEMLLSAGLVETTVVARTRPRRQLERALLLGRKRG